MDRRVRHVVVIGVAVLTAALASFGVYLTLKRMPVREVEVARTYVVVAARALPTGVRVAAADLKVVPWPASSMVHGGFAKVDDVVDRGLVASVVENEPLIESKLAPRDGGAGLSSTIPARHARDVGQGERRHRRRRVPRSRHAGRSDGDDSAQGRQLVANRREQRAGAARRGRAAISSGPRTPRRRPPRPRS